MYMYVGCSFFAMNHTTIRPFLTTCRLSSSSFLIFSSENSTTINFQTEKPFLYIFFGSVVKMISCCVTITTNSQQMIMTCLLWVFMFSHFTCLIQNSCETDLTWLYVNIFCAFIKIFSISSHRRENTRGSLFFHIIDKALLS
jgi:hypothetical protein